MFTRFKVFYAIVIFVLCHLLISSVWGADGLYARRALEEENRALEEVRREKEEKVRTLERMESADYRRESESLKHVASFATRSVYVPSTGAALERRSVRTFSPLLVALLSMIPSVVFLIVAELKEQWTRERNNGENRNEKGRGGHDVWSD